MKSIVSPSSMLYLSHTTDVDAELTQFIGRTEPCAVVPTYSCLLGRVFNVYHHCPMCSIPLYEGLRNNDKFEEMDFCIRAHSKVGTRSLGGVTDTC